MKIIYSLLQCHLQVIYMVVMPGARILISYLPCKTPVSSSIDRNLRQTWLCIVLQTLYIRSYFVSFKSIMASPISYSHYCLSNYHEGISWLHGFVLWQQVHSHALLKLVIRRDWIASLTLSSTFLGGKSLYDLDQLSSPDIVNYWLGSVA